MRAPLSWIREFVDVPESAEEVGVRLSLRGLALEGIERVEGDAVLDFDVTANRPDCLSIRGLAREIATAFDRPLLTRKTASRASGHGRPPGTEHFDVSIEAPDVCQRYVAALAEVTVRPSPDWMQARLRACGQRPINNIVDITNYVLLELGYPMHAFDLARLAGPAIVVRRAQAGETLVTLDGKSRTLDPEMLVIADAERAQAIGGVMGGADSEVRDGTTHVVFEAAWFKPSSVRATSKRLGLRSEASYRFERGADLTATADAMARALALLEAMDAGRAVAPVIDRYPAPHDARVIALDTRIIARVLGMEVPALETARILEQLGFGVRTLGGWEAAAPDAATPLSHAGSGWQVTVPGWRVDVQRPVDLVEEVGRHYGFEHLPTTFPAVEQAPRGSDPRIARDALVRMVLAAAGLSEAITFAFVESAAAEPFAGADALVTLANPLSEKFTTLRPSLLPGLLDALSHNRRHAQRDVRLFEIGTRFSPAGETRAVAAAWTGAATPEHWSGAAREVDFFDLKGVAEQVCRALQVDVAFESLTAPYLVDGRAAALSLDGQTVGVLGQLHPDIAERRDLPGADATYVLEIDLDALSARSPREARFVDPLPRHPAVVRDVAILVDDTLSAATVRGTIRAAGPVTLVDVREFDRYQGKGIPEGKVSLALRLTFQAPDRTLTDAEVQAAMTQIDAALTRQLGAERR